MNPPMKRWGWLRRYSLESPSALIRIYAQESNDFVVVERGQGMQNLQQERALGASGELQSGSNMGKGQMVVAALGDGEAPTAGLGFNEGDVAHSKIDGVTLMATASDTSKVIAALKKSDDLVVRGSAAGGYIKVLGSMSEGFVKAVLVAK